MHLVKGALSLQTALCKICVSESKASFFPRRQPPLGEAFVIRENEVQADASRTARDPENDKVFQHGAQGRPITACEVTELNENDTHNDNTDCSFCEPSPE